MTVGLRDCPRTQEMLFADHTGLFPLDLAPGCMRHDLGTCLGPCAAACSQTDYNTKVAAARAFLAGQDLTPLVHLDRAMKEAAAKQIFERAAVLRDKLGALSWLHRQLDRMRQAEAMGNAIYPVQGHDGLWRWYLLHGGRVVAAVMASGGEPNVIETRELHALAEKHGRRGRPADRIAGVLLLAAWFRRCPGERQELIHPM